MARDDVTTQPIVQNGIAPVLTAPTEGSDGDVIDTGRVFLLVDNADTVAHEVTVVTPVQIGGLELEDLVVSVPAGEQRFIGPFKPSLYGQPVGTANVGRAHVNYDPDTTGVTRGVFAL